MTASCRSGRTGSFSDSFMRGTHRTWRDTAEPELFGGGTEPKLVSARGLERLNFTQINHYTAVTKRIIRIFDYICDHFSKKGGRSSFKIMLLPRPSSNPHRQPFDNEVDNELGTQ